jgi:hypothetical protein
VPVKTESEITDFFPATDCCAACTAVIRNAAPPHSDVDEKRRQRDDVLRAVADALSAPWAAGAAVNVFLLDDPLEDRLLTAEIWQRFPDAAGRLRVFTPNLNADVVRGLAIVKGAPPGGVVSGVGCVCNFLAHWAPTVAASGGFAVVFADVPPRLWREIRAHNGAAVRRRIVRNRMLYVAPRPRRATTAVSGEAAAHVPVLLSVGHEDRFVHAGREVAMGHAEAVMRALGGFGTHPYDLRVYAQQHYSERRPVDSVRTTTGCRSHHDGVLQRYGRAPGRRRQRHRRLPVRLHAG